MESSSLTLNGRPASLAAVPMPLSDAVPTVAAPVRWSSRELLAGTREVEIEHEGMVYRLRLTAMGKLILTK